MNGMANAIGMVELTSIARGIETSDFMVKAAQVELIRSSTVCPGKYIIIIAGDTGDVKASMAEGIRQGGESVVNTLLLPNAHPQLIPAISMTTQPPAGGAVGVLGAALVLLPDLVPYAMSRIESWQNPWLDAQGDGHQIIQSMYAIGSGGAAGLGLGSSRQKHLFVPEPQNDFIFSIVCEELGFVGACAVVGLFVLLLCRGIVIAAHAPDRFGALLVVGFVVQVALQAVLNVAVVTNTIPNTGISLPFFSSGGTSLMMLLGEMGVVLRVSRYEA